MLTYTARRQKIESQKFNEFKSSHAAELLNDKIKIQFQYAQAVYNLFNLVTGTDTLLKANIIELVYTALQTRQ